MTKTYARIFLAVGLALLVVACGDERDILFQAGVNAYNRGDYQTALKKFLPLADQGDAGAQTYLGVMYAEGQGVPQDYVEAQKWYRRAADQGHTRAQTNLGSMYGKGLGVPQDDAEALKWYRRAADQGFAAAQANLGVMNYEGKGEPKDYVLAYMWLILAARQDANFVEARDIIAEKLTPDQLAEAQRLAREWKAKSAK